MQQDRPPKGWDPKQRPGLDAYGTSGRAFISTYSERAASRRAGTCPSPGPHSLTAPGAPQRPRSGQGGRCGARRGGVAAGLLSTLCARRPERADRPAAAAGKARAPVPGDPRPEAGLPGDEGRPRPALVTRARPKTASTKKRFQPTVRTRHLRFPRPEVRPLWSGSSRT